MTEKISYRELSSETRRRLWASYRRGDEKGRRELLEYNYPLVRAVVSRFAFDEGRREDLFHSGVIGLMDAMAHFDPDRGVAFGTYAFPYIKGEILKSLAEMKGTKKNALWGVRSDVSLKQALSVSSVSLEEWMEAAESLCFADRRAEEMFAAAEDRIALKEALSDLDEEERKLLYHRYILRKSQAETGEVFSLSQTRISRKERDILAKLRDMM